MNLYKTWSHCQASILALVLFAGCYRHAVDIVHAISKQTITMEFMLELDKILQIMESPMFTCKYIDIYTFMHQNGLSLMFAVMRLEMTNSDVNDDLIKALYTLMHLMPQTTMFRKLNERLNSCKEDQFSHR